MLPLFSMIVVIGFFSFPDLCGWEFFATFKTGKPGNLRSSIIGRASLDFLFFARVAPNARRFRDGGVCLAGQAILGLGIDAFPARLTAETSQIVAGWVGGGGGKSLPGDRGSRGGREVNGGLGLGCLWKGTEHLIFIDLFVDAR